MGIFRIHPDDGDSAVDVLGVKTTRNNSQDVETVSDASSEGFTYLDSTEDA